MFPIMDATLGRQVIRFVVVLMPKTIIVLSSSGIHRHIGRMSFVQSLCQYLHSIYNFYTHTHTHTVTTTRYDNSISNTQSLQQSSSVQHITPYLLYRTAHSAVYTAEAQSLPTVVSQTAAKIKPLIFSLSGFALSYDSNICIFIILYTFRLVPAQSCDKITNTLYTATHTQTDNRCRPPDTDNSAQNLDSQVVELLNRSVTTPYFKGRQEKGIMELTGHLLKVNLI